MPFPANPNDGDLWIEEARHFVFDDGLPGWRLSGDAGADRGHNLFQVTNIGNAVDPQDAIPLHQAEEVRLVPIADIPPLNAAPGQLWWRNDPDGVLFIRYDDGVTQQWVIASPTGAGQAAIFVGPAPPPRPLEGQLWYRTDPDGDTYIYYNDGQGLQWVTISKAAGTIAAANNLADQVEEHVPIVFPPNPNFGDEFTSPSGGTYRWDGIVWQGLMAPLDAPSDGASYGRLNASWSQVLPLTGGLLTGPLEIQNQIGFSRVTLTVAGPASRASMQFNFAGLANWDFHMPGFGPNLNALVFGRHNITNGLPLDNPLVISNSSTTPGTAVFNFGGMVRLDRSPTLPDQAATKDYVDTIAASAQRLVGGYDAAAGIVIYDPALGIPPGPLPPASPANASEYVIVYAAGTPPVGPPEVLRPMVVGDWIISLGFAWVVLEVGGSDALARNVSLNPIAFGAGNVQDSLLNAETRAAAADANIAAVDGRKLNLAGGTMTGGIGFGSTVAPGGAGDVSRHLALYDTTYGIGITSGRMNYNVGAIANSHFFRAGNTDIVAITGSGIDALQRTMYNLRDPTGVQDAANKRYVDARASSSTGWVNAENYQNGFTGGVQSRVATVGGVSAIYLRGNYNRSGLGIPAANTGAFFLAAGHRPVSTRCAVGAIGYGGGAAGYATLEINPNGHVYISNKGPSDARDGWVDGIVISV